MQHHIASKKFGYHCRLSLTLPAFLALMSHDVLSGEFIWSLKFIGPISVPYILLPIHIISWQWLDHSSVSYWWIVIYTFQQVSNSISFITSANLIPPPPHLSYTNNGLCWRSWKRSENKASSWCSFSFGDCIQGQAWRRGTILDGMKEKVLMD